MIVTPRFLRVKSPVCKELDTDIDANKAAISVLSSMPTLAQVIFHGFVGYWSRAAAS
jgi:hypothetical protein